VSACDPACGTVLLNLPVGSVQGHCSIVSGQVRPTVLLEAPNKTGEAIWAETASGVDFLPAGGTSRNTAAAAKATWTVAPYLPPTVTPTVTTIVATGGAIDPTNGPCLFTATAVTSPPNAP
jgi:hypothetical protein